MTRFFTLAALIASYTEGSMTDSDDSSITSNGQSTTTDSVIEKRISLAPPRIEEFEVEKFLTTGGLTRITGDHHLKDTSRLASPDVTLFCIEANMVSNQKQLVSINALFNTHPSGSSNIVPDNIFKWMNESKEKLSASDDLLPSKKVFSFGLQIKSDHRERTISIMQFVRGRLPNNYHEVVSNFLFQAPRYKKFSLNARPTSKFVSRVGKFYVDVDYSSGEGGDFKKVLSVYLGTDVETTPMFDYQYSPVISHGEWRIRALLQDTIYVPVVISTSSAVPPMLPGWLCNLLKEPAVTKKATLRKYVDFEPPEQNRSSKFGILNLRLLGITVNLREYTVNSVSGNEPFFEEPILIHPSLFRSGSRILFDGVNSRIGLRYIDQNLYNDIPV